LKGKEKMKYIKHLWIASLATMFPLLALAEEGSVTTESFLTDVLKYVQQFGGLPWTLKVAGLVLLVVASMKVSFLKTLVWDKLGAAKAWLAPVLGLVGGVLSLGVTGQPITIASVSAYVFAGAGAVILHELLDTLKSAPGLGAMWVSLINLVQSMLGGKKE
jgi:hypothetical protein